jgi:hypothetical protein
MFSQTLMRLLPVQLAPVTTGSAVDAAFDRLSFTASQIAQAMYEVWPSSRTLKPIGKK